MPELTPNSVVHGLIDLSRQLDKLTDGLGQLDRESVEAREDYVLAYAKAFLASEGTVDERKQRTLLTTHAERKRAEGADAAVRQRKEQIWAVKTRIEVGRTAGAVVRSEMELAR
jgi:hypothetical protein